LFILTENSRGDVRLSREWLCNDRGGKYSNDQAGCELNWDCTQLRAHNKDSADHNPLGVDGPWVNALTGTSLAQWHGFIMKCSIATVK
jgi:hypothetical protein